VSVFHLHRVVAALAIAAGGVFTLALLFVRLVVRQVPGGVLDGALDALAGGRRFFRNRIVVARSVRIVRTIVIFQSDIRRALAHFGQAPFFRYFNRQESADETIEEVVVASTMLAQQRVGAIIAIEREIGLRNYIESGIPLDATLTYDLLVTIFKPGSPLHDGAVILQEGRVAAAACFLPLTVNPRLSRELGTRHRAAIGLTEESDAAAIVVSEESGAISIALNGAINRGLTPDELRERLKALVQQRRGAIFGRSSGA